MGYYRSDFKGVTTAIPKRLDTFIIPTALRYFDVSGFFAGIGAAYVHQEIMPPLGRSEDSDSSFIVDAAFGYRLPNRRGLISFTINNVFDDRFKYQDDTFAGLAQHDVAEQGTPQLQARTKRRGLCPDGCDACYYDERDGRFHCCTVV